MAGKVINTSDAEAIKKREEDLKFKALQYAEDLKECMKNPYARRVLCKIFLRCKVLFHIFEPSSGMAWNEGRRSIGVELIDDIKNFCPEDLTSFLSQVILQEEKR